jgi:hypothetical protein
MALLKEASISLSDAATAWYATPDEFAAGTAVLPPDFESVVRAHRDS